MGPSPTYHPPEGEECETSVEHGLPLWAEPAVGYCPRRPRPSPMWGSRFVGARAVGPWVGEQKPLGKSPLRGNPSPESTYLPTYLPTYLHRAVIRHPFVSVVLIWWPNGWLFSMVPVFRGERGYLKYLDLYLQGSMSGDLGRQVVVLRLCHLDVCRVRVAEVDAGICRARLWWSVRGLAS